MVKLGIKENPFLYDFVLASQFNKFNIDKDCYKRLKKGIKDSLPKNEALRSLCLSLTHSMLFFHPQISTWEKKDYHKNLDLSAEYLEEYYCIVKLKYYCEKLSSFKYRNELLKNDFFNELTDLLDKSKQSELVLIQLLNLTVSFLLQTTFQSYEKLNQFYFEHYSNIYSEKGYVITRLYYGLIGLHHPNRLQELYRIQKFGLKNNLFIEQGILASSEYNSFVIVYCSLGKPEEAESFVKEYSPYLKETGVRLANIKVRALCHIAFAKKDYQAVFDKLEDITLKDYDYVLDKYSLSFRTYYELGYTYLIEEKERGLTEFLKGKNIGQVYRESFSNMYELITMLINYRPKNYNKGQLTEKLQSYGGHIVEPQWFKRKIEEL